ncbi:Germ cell-specific gene 1 protein [Galemys pyrenaicus]|uniref:Germ cell-specific gene 1 protein n=1 Tax=Galemys pyrenaicus TaxID=202257 RepID=A0A8J6A7N4_GALPY|nr:Germ cell-specific gene 1 protein [Galemys pyrenaicus]
MGHGPASQARQALGPQRCGRGAAQTQTQSKPAGEGHAATGHGALGFSHCCCGRRRWPPVGPGLASPRGRAGLCLSEVPAGVGEPGSRGRVSEADRTCLLQMELPPALSDQRAVLHAGLRLLPLGVGVAPLLGVLRLVGAQKVPEPLLGEGLAAQRPALPLPLDRGGAHTPASEVVRQRRPNGPEHLAHRVLCRGLRLPRQEAVEEPEWWQQEALVKAGRTMTSLTRERALARKARREDTAWATARTEDRAMRPCACAAVRQRGRSAEPSLNSHHQPREMRKDYWNLPRCKAHVTPLSDLEGSG